MLKQSNGNDHCEPSTSSPLTEIFSSSLFFLQMPLIRSPFSSVSSPNPSFIPFLKVPWKKSPSVMRSPVPSAESFSHQPSQQSPSEQVQVPVPCFLPLDHMPLQLSPLTQVIVPSPSQVPASKWPLYQFFASSMQMPSPSMIPFLYSPSQMAPDLYFIFPLPFFIPFSHLPSQTPYLVYSTPSSPLLTPFWKGPWQITLQIFIKDLSSSSLQMFFLLSFFISFDPSLSLSSFSFSSSSSSSNFWTSSSVLLFSLFSVKEVCSSLYPFFLFLRKYSVPSPFFSLSSHSPSYLQYFLSSRPQPHFFPSLNSPLQMVWSFEFWCSSLSPSPSGMSSVALFTLPMNLDLVYLLQMRSFSSSPSQQFVASSLIRVVFSIFWPLMHRIILGTSANFQIMFSISALGFSKQKVTLFFSPQLLREFQICPAINRVGIVGSLKVYSKGSVMMLTSSANFSTSSLLTYWTLMPDDLVNIAQINKQLKKPSTYKQAQTERLFEGGSPALCIEILQ